MDSGNDDRRQESESLEFKESLAEREDAGKTLVAFANKDGGEVIFGMRNDGTAVGISDPSEDTIRRLEQLFTDNTDPKLYPAIGPFTVDGKLLLRVAVQKSAAPYHTFKGHGYVRVGLSDKKLTQEELHSRWMRFNSNTADFSAGICDGLLLADLDPAALEALRSAWAQKEQRPEYRQFAVPDILDKLLLRRGDHLTYAALLLCGKAEAISRLLPEAEIRFGWKGDAQKLDFDFHRDWRAPFLLAIDEFWEAVNARNLRYPYAQGFFEGDIWAFDRQSVREALLNAFAHRDYQARGSVFVEASPEALVVRSPGHFLPGVSPENILDAEGLWRNRLLMEALGKIGLVERYGHGLDRIFQRTIAEGKGKPRIEELSTGQVRLTIPAQVKDERFIAFLNALAEQKQITFDFVKDLLFLDDIREHQKSDDAERKQKFLRLGIIEKTGVGKGTRYILSSKLYEFIGETAEYTRKRWLAREQQKELLWHFFQRYKKGRMKDFRDGLFERRLSSTQVLRLLNLLKAEGRIYFDGKQRSPSAYWRIKG